MSSEKEMAATRGRGSVPESGPGRSRRPDYQGRAGEVAGIAVTNGLLALVTLGFYRFWGKTRLRRYLWGRVGFDGDAFEYTGTGKELFIGFLVAIAILIPLVILSAAVEFVFPTNLAVLAVRDFVQGLLILFLMQFAIYRARRYRLTRTQWRGIRAGQSGKAVNYALSAMLWYFLVGITFGLAYPAMRAAWASGPAAMFGRADTICSWRARKRASVCWRLPLSRGACRRRTFWPRTASLLTLPRGAEPLTGRWPIGRRGLRWTRRASR